MIYLDHAATSPISKKTAEEINTFLTESFYNISSVYPPALNVRAQVEFARETVAAALNVQKEQVCFTSCATESNNWVIFNVPKRKNGNIVISGGEHDSVYRPAMELKAKGTDVRIVKLCGGGHIDLNDLNSKIDENTALVSVIHCSNETGAVNDLQAVCDIVKGKSNALVHSDGVQAFCKTGVSPGDINIDYYTVSAHKIGGAKGIGALYYKKPLNPLFFGGGQERGLRIGTENTAAIIGFASAVKSFLAAKDENRVSKINSIFRNILADAIFINTHIESFNENNNGPNFLRENFMRPEYSGWILQLSYPYLKAEILMNMLYDKGVIVGLGSACSSKKSQNRVLAETGMEKSITEGSIRLSFSVNTTINEAEEAAKIINAAAKELKSRLRIRKN